MGEKNHVHDLDYKKILSNVGYVTSMDAKKTNSLILKQKSYIKLQYLTKKDSIGQK